jgi:hypothetical protein
MVDKYQGSEQISGVDYEERSAGNESYLYGHHGAFEHPGIFNCQIVQGAASAVTIGP